MDLLPSKTGYGPHLMIDLEECNEDLLGSLKNVTDFLSTMPGIIGMTKLLEPAPLEYRPPEELEWGITGFVIIAESHISIHTYPKLNYAFVDIFSCRPFNTKHALEITKQRFESKRADDFLTYRGARFREAIL